VSIRRHGKIWWLDIWCGKKRLRRSLHTSEHALAIERARDITVELRKPKPAGTPIAEFSAQYLTWARQTKPASYGTEQYRVAIIKSWFNKVGILTLEGITSYHVEQFRAYVMTRHVGHGDKTIGRTTANRYLALLRTMLNKAADWGMFEGRNPVSKVKFYREGAKVRPLTEDDVGRVLEAAREISTSKHTSPTGRAIYDICRVVLNTGLRRSEVLNLRWADIGDDELQIRGKGGKVRTIPLNAEAHSIIKRQYRTSSFVFAVPNRNSSGVLRRVTETIKRKTDVPFHVHLFRHTFASRLLAAGVDVVTIGDILGHSAHMTTLLYAHSSPARKRQAVDALTGHGHPDVSR
jgi:integrase